MVYFIGRKCEYVSGCEEQSFYELQTEGEVCPHDLNEDDENCINYGVHEVMFSFYNMGTMIGKFEKTVFLTREEAEAALERKQNES